MDKFASQQAALRCALATVLGADPIKGQLVISDEQRSAVGELMMGWLKEGRWSIKDGTRAAQEPLQYITGKRPTDLIQAWTKPRKPAEAKGAVTGTDPMAAISKALELGLITKEQAAEAAMKLIAG